MTDGGIRPALRVNGGAVDAEAFYALACDPRRSAVVEACAGAGKTWMLVSRILRALLDGAEPSQILAITFTRKAAGEMRARLDEWLHDFAAPAATLPQRIDALRQRGLSPAEAEALAPALGTLHAHVLAQSRPVEIRTFHGWFAQLLAQAPLDLLERLGLSPGLQLIEDPEVLGAELYQAFHRAVQGDPDRRGDYVALVRSHRRHTVQAWLDATWLRRSEVELAAAAGHLHDAVPPASKVFEGCAPGAPLAVMHDAGWRRELQDLAAALGARAKTKSTQAAERLLAALQAADPQDAFDLAWQALFTATGTPRRQLGDLPAQEAVCARLETLARWARQQAAHEDHARMARLAEVLLAEYAALKRRRGLADMGDLETVALAMLADDEMSGWLQARLDRRLRHLLIDEFQDTSPLQWRALHGWLSGYAGTGAGQALSVFIVGDPKQSIYRFRRAEPRVFAAARDFVRQGLDGVLLECDHTRRNAGALVDALNTVFADAAVHDGWGGFRPHSTAAGGGGQLRRLPGVARERSRADTESDTDAAGWRDSLSVPRHQAEEQRRLQEARQVADAVAELMTQGVAPGEVMVLARKRSMLALVAQAFAEAGLPATLPELLDVGAAPAAGDLLAVLDVLASPGHDLSLARALKSPLFGASDADLLALARAARAAGTWWSALVAMARPPSDALQRARLLLLRWEPLARRLPPHDLLDRIVGEGEVMARLAAALPAHRRRAALQAVDALLAAALETEGGRYVSPYRFVRAMRRMEVRTRLSAPPDAVRLLTVHGAKGLEARWVFVLDADPERRQAERATLLVDWPPDAAAPKRVAFVARESAIAPSLADLLAAEQRERQREEINGLYVAMTRAEEGLVFSRSEPRVGAERAWWTRVQGLATPWPASVAGRQSPSHAPARVAVLPTLDGAAPAPATAEPAPSTTDAQIGRAVHRLLEWIGRPDRPLAPTQWAPAARAAATEFGVAAESGRVLDTATRVTQSSACRRFFVGADLVWAGNEVPLADAGEGARVDRLVALQVDGAVEWWVLDYKLGARPQEVDANRRQLARYVEIVRRAQPGEVVRGAFITGQGELVAM